MIDLSGHGDLCPLPHVLLLFGVGFLIANLRVGLDFVRYWRRRRQRSADLAGPRPPYYGLILFLGHAWGCCSCQGAVHSSAPQRCSARAMMFLYSPTRCRSRADRAGVLRRRHLGRDGFMPYQQIGGIAWRKASR